jgi:hypothetical protein
LWRSPVVSRRGGGTSLDRGTTRPAWVPVVSFIRNRTGRGRRFPHLRRTLCVGVGSGRDVSYGGSVGGRRLAASRSVTHPTRLETRTKESNMCASQWVLNRPMGAMKAKVGFTSSESGSLSSEGAHRRPVLSDSSVGRSVSVHVGTRKMVNYARTGRGQRKLWWRSAAVLTCKSIVRSGFRGERLIEPSSSWFPPKFPSG